MTEQRPEQSIIDAIQRTKERRQKRYGEKARHWRVGFAQEVATEVLAAERERIREKAYEMAVITYHGDRAVPLGQLIGWLRFGGGR